MYAIQCTSTEVLLSTIWFPHWKHNQTSRERKEAVADERNNPNKCQCRNSNSFNWLQTKAKEIRLSLILILIVEINFPLFNVPLRNESVSTHIVINGLKNLEILRIHLLPMEYH